MRTVITGRGEPGVRRDDSRRRLASKWVGVNPSKSMMLSDDRLPVEPVTWYDAVSDGGKLTAREKAAGRLPPGGVYRLPTEAEWEYACRAQSTAAFRFESRAAVSPSWLVGFRVAPRFPG